MAVEQFFGARTVWRSDIKPAAVKLIDHYWPGTNLGDITAIDWDNVEPVDIISGGSPCQDMSAAGKRAGMEDGTRSGLWSNMRDAIETIRPRYVVWENVRGAYSAAADSNMEPCPWCVGDTAGIDLRACGRVLGDLAELGYDAQWCGLRAADAGAPHGRFRVFILAADAEDNRRSSLVAGGSGSELAGSSGDRWSASNSDGLVGPAGGSREGRPGAMDQPGTLKRVVRPDRTSAATDATNERPGRGGTSGHAPEVAADAGYQGSVADAEGDGRDAWRAESAGIVRGSDAGERGASTLADTQRIPVDWGQYEPAIRRWETVLGRPAPAPTVTGPKGGQQLSPDLTDWMMGWPEGWTNVPGIKRAERLSLCGDGVVPQQALEALRRLWPYVSERAA